MKGRIIDSLSREPLAFVNVIYGKGNIGTTTNIDGWFTIKTDQKKLSLSVTYIGYEKKSVTVDPSVVRQPYVIEIKPLTYNLNEVTVLPGENPANRIMQKVIDNREINDPEKLPAFSYLSYNRLHFTLETERSVSSKSDTIRISKLQYDKLLNKNKKDMLRDFMNKQHLFLMETISKRYYNGPGKNKETIVASKTSGLQQPYIFLLANQFQSFSVYGEEFELGTKKYASPICNSCTGKYFYLIEDTLLNEAADSIFVISFRPSRGKNFNGLTGVMHINTRQYAVENISATPTVKDTMMGVSIQQKYRFVENKAWFPVELNTELELNNFSGVLVDTIPLSDSTGVRIKQRFIFAGKGKSYLDSIDLDPDLSLVRFNQVEVAMDKKAVLNDPSYFENYRPDSLSEKDLNTYHFIDSVGKSVNLDNKIRIMTYMLTGYIPFYWIDFDLYRFLSYNRYEGLRAGCGIRTNEKLLSWLSAGGYFAYGVKDEKYKYGYSLRLKQPTPGEAYAEYSFYDDLHEPGKSEFTTRKSLTNSEMYRSILLDVFDHEISQNLSVYFRMLKSFTVTATASESSITPDSGFCFYPNEFTAPDKFVFRQAGIKIRFLYNEKFTETFFGRISMGSDFPDVNLSVNFYQPDVGNSFIKSEIKIISKINLHFAGSSKITFKGGYINGKAPQFMCFNANGSFAPLSLDAENTFQTMRPYEFFSSRYASIFFRHSFGSLLFSTPKFKPGIELIHNMCISGKLEGFQGDYASSFESIFIESGINLNNLVKASFAGYGIGVYYRYGLYSDPIFKNNIYVKLDIRFAQ